MIIIIICFKILNNALEFEAFHRHWMTLSTVEWW